MKRIYYNKVYVVAACLVPCLAAILLAVKLRTGERTERTEALETALKDARKKAEEAVVVRSISKQMEEIAYQQKELSDRQRRNAELQAEENYLMKLRVEEEWKRAVAAQEEAERAYRLADSQKELAEERQKQSEHAKRVADTLAYLTLGRSLGSTATTQYRAGNRETASLLAYSAWTFVKRYGGDCFTPSVYGALTLASGQPSVWQRHKGGTSGIVWKDENTFYTAGRYGEVLEWTADGNGGYDTKTLLSDPQRDFRDLSLAADGTLYALSYSGEVVAFPGDRVEIHGTGEKKCLKILLSGGRLWLLASDGRLRSADGAHCLPLDSISCVAVYGSCLLAGLKNGDLVQVGCNGQEIRTIGNYHRAAVTAIATDRTTGMTAWGYADGIILLAGSDGKRLKRLVGHRSAISGLAFSSNRLCSCSNDRTLRLWNLDGERAESVTALESGAWLLALALSPDGKTALVGDADGRLYRLSVSPDNMAAGIRKSLDRELTRQEWDYYIGKGIPYETYTDNQKH